MWHTNDMAWGDMVPIWVWCGKTVMWHGQHCAVWHAWHDVHIAQGDVFPNVFTWSHTKTSPSHVFTYGNMTSYKKNIMQSLMGMLSSSIMNMTSTLETCCQLTSTHSFLLSYWTIGKIIVRYGTTLRVQVKMFVLLMKSLSTIIWTFKVWGCCLAYHLVGFGCFPSESLFHTMAMAT
jgi:hypothetical protein